MSLVFTGLAAGSHERLIKRDRAVGVFNLRAGTLQKAREAFGKPTRIIPKTSGCRAGWSTIGLRMRFSVSGKFTPSGEFRRLPVCRKVAGVFQVDVRSRVWRTDRGLRVGNPARRVRRLYPNVIRIPGTNEWALHTQHVGDVEVATASAITRKGRVIVLRVSSY